MISEEEIMVMGFIALGGVTMLLPAVLLRKITIIGILKGIGAVFLIIIFSTLFYLVVTDSTLLEILTLKTNSIILPKRIFSVSYIMIVVLILVLPVAIVRNYFGGKSERA